MIRYSGDVVALLLFFYTLPYYLCGYLSYDILSFFLPFFPSFPFLLSLQATLFSRTIRPDRIEKKRKERVAFFRFLTQSAFYLVLPSLHSFFVQPALLLSSPLPEGAFIPYLTLAYLILSVKYNYDCGVPASARWGAGKVGRSMS